MKKSLMIAMLASSAIAAPSVADSYVTAFGGVNWDDVASPLSSDSGVLVGVAVGMPVKAVDGLRAELELAHRSNDVEAFKIDAIHSTTSVMANLHYDLNIQVGPAQPYIMVGAGYAHTEGVIEGISLASVEGSGFAWQLGTGLTVPVADGITANVGYRYFQGPEIDVLGFEASDGSNHSVMAGLSFAL